jgi:hypothetical protein
MKFHEFRYSLIPLDNDLLSLEEINSFRDSSLDQSNIPLFSIANSIMVLQEKFGVIPFIQGKGDQAQVYNG